MNLSERRKSDIPFIGSDDFHYETETGKKLIVDSDRFYGDFDEWFSEEVGFSIRSEHIIDAILTDNVKNVITYIKTAWELGRKLGIEECTAFSNVEHEL